MTEMYSQKGERLTKEALETAYDSLSPTDQRTIDRQIDYIDAGLKARKAIRLRDGLHKDPRTHFGRVSAMELVASLGIWLDKVRKEDPDAWKALSKSVGDGTHKRRRKI